MTTNSTLTPSESLPAVELPAVPTTEIISDTQAHQKDTEAPASGNENERGTESQIYSGSNNFKSPVWITWTGFYSIWFFWIMCCFSTFLAFEIILGTIGGGVIGKYKLDVLGYKIPVKHLISGVFAGSLEVGSLAATWLTRRHEETEE